VVINNSADIIQPMNQSNGISSDRLPYLSREQLNHIHQASMQILKRIGIQFNHSAANEIFSRNGFKVDQCNVFLGETEVLKALETCPSEFIIYGRNSQYDVHVGGDHFVLLPTGGATMVMENDKQLRPGSIADYENCCKLVQTSKQLDMNGFIMVHPNDIPAKKAHLEMIFRNYLLCEKPFITATHSSLAAMEALEMADIVWNGRDRLVKRPVMVAMATVTSPLKYDEDQIDCILQYAKSNQPIVLITMPLAGLTGPLNLLTLMSQVNAEILAGIVLVQHISPGTPVIYGSFASPIDMKTMIPAMAASETVQLSFMAAQMAKFYRLPCRTGGALTNAQVADYQAGVESSLLLSTALRAGANFVFHACGLLASGSSMSFAKWLLDEELCSQIRRIFKPLVVENDAIDIADIEEVGIGGSFLTHDTTLKNFRQLSSSDVFYRKKYSNWVIEGAAYADQATNIYLKKRLQTYCQPSMDQGLKQELQEYILRKCAE